MDTARRHDLDVLHALLISTNRSKVTTGNRGGEPVPGVRGINY
jgi:hypothetical protein